MADVDADDETVESLLTPLSSLRSDASDSVSERSMTSLGERFPCHNGRRCMGSDNDDQQHQQLQ